MQKKEYGYSLAEILIAITLIGFLFVVTFYNIPKMLPDENKAGFKKGYGSLESAIAALLADTDIYTVDDGFADTTKITFEGTGVILGKENKQSKFRDAIKYRLPVVKDNITCELADGSRSNKCFKTQDGIVLGIPDTNFKDSGTLTYTSDVNGGVQITVAQIAFYPTWRDSYNLREDGFIINIQSNGGINFESNTGSFKKDDSKTKLEVIEEYMTSTTIKQKVK